MADRRHAPVTNVVCLGIGSWSNYHYKQFAIASQIVAQLAKIQARYEAAVKLGFEDGIDRFSLACDAGFAAEYSPARRTLFCRYGAGCCLEPGTYHSFEDYYNQYRAVSITITNDIKRWLSIAMDSTDRIRILEGYLGGDRALEPVEALRSVDVDN
ncbi:uncharacterized protein RSE6_11752 [Rhynchosporium secalis]|uniref:Uncharacterized protein n=1 Tax=Rhynchosporium secalis TaxID=38038 RepID=A0A1E1MNS7_RHYSE|nr:uncharacterized protein RSE6_11752 [Rhynchosporium secalis]